VPVGRQRHRQADEGRGRELPPRGRAVAGRVSAFSRCPVKRSTVQKLPTTLEASAEDARLLAQVIDYLKQSPETLAYLEKRGIANAVAIVRFELGFVNLTLGYRLATKNRKVEAAIRGQLQRLGLYRSPTGHSAALPRQVTRFFFTDRDCKFLATSNTQRYL